MKATHYALTQYGFEYGEALVERLFRHADGSVVISVSSRHRPHVFLQINVSPKGRSVTVYGHGYEGRKSKTRRAK